MNTAPLLPKEDDYVVAIHPKIKKKKVKVQVTKVLKASFHGRDSSHVIITGFTHWEPAAESKPEPPAKFKAGDRVRIVSTGINGCGIVVAKISDDSKSNNIYRILLDGKENSELFPDDEENEIILDFQPGDRVIMAAKKLKGKIGTIIEKTEEDKESRFLNNFYRIQLDGDELSCLYSKDEFNFDLEPVEKNVESSESETVTITQKQLEFLSFEEAINTSELNKNELLERAVSEHHTIVGIEKEEEKLALFKLQHARIAGVYFSSFKERCAHGEFEKSLNALGVSERIAQTYMQIVTFWGLIEEKSKPLLAEGHTFSIRWALSIIRDERKSQKMKSAAPTPPAPSKDLPLFEMMPPIMEGSRVEVEDGKTGFVTGFTSSGNQAVVRFEPNDNGPQSDLIDLKKLHSVEEEVNDRAKKLGLTNGKSVLPDLRDRDRFLAEKLDPTTVDDRPGYYPVGMEIRTLEEDITNPSFPVENFWTPEKVMAEEEGIDYPPIEEKAKHASLLEKSPGEEIKKAEVVEHVTGFPSLIIRYDNGRPIHPPTPLDDEDEEDENDREPEDELIGALVSAIKDSEYPEYVIAGIIKSLLPGYKSLIESLISITA